MDNQPNTVLQNTTNTYGDGATLHTFFQRHKRPSDDGTTGPLKKKPKMEATADSQEVESQENVEDFVEEVRVPRTNTFKMLQNMFRARNALVQPSSTSSYFWWSGGKKVTTVIAVPTNRILESFVSSEKADAFYCHSVRDGVSISPPYACAFSNGKGPFHVGCHKIDRKSHLGAKRGKSSSLAVAAEDGAVHIVNTAKRKDWDHGINASDHSICLG